MADPRLSDDLAMFRGQFSGLDLTYFSATQAKIDVGECRDSTDSINIVVGTQLTVDITVDGAGGLETSLTEAADTWYAVLLIADSVNDTPNAVKGLLDVSETAPNLPSGYDKFRWVGWWRNNASSNQMNFKQDGTSNFRRVWWVEENSTLQALSDGSATTYTAVDLSDFMPPTSELAMLEFEWRTSNNSGAAAANRCKVRTTGSGLTTPPYRIRTGVKTNNRSSHYLEVPTDSNQSMDYECSHSSNKVDIYVKGYQEEL